MVSQMYIILILLALNTVKSQRRIHGGEVAEPAQFPHAVHLNLPDGQCTGCIIHKDWVITAAHCIIDSSGKKVRPNDVKMTAGTVDVEVDNQMSQSRYGKKILLTPEEFKLSVGENDLSLIQVNEPFIFSKYIRKAEFMTSPWPQNKKHLFENCVAAGWGMTEFGSSSKMKYINTTARHGRKTCPCIRKYDQLKKIVCLPKIVGQGACFGDSGGALLCDGEIVGIAHILKDKRDCSSYRSPDTDYNCGNKYTYAIYMYTCPYMPWISNYVPGIPPKPDSCKGIIFCCPSKVILILLNIIHWVFLMYLCE